MKNMLLINGLGSAASIVNGLLSKTEPDINIYLSYPLGVLTLAGWIRQELPRFDIQLLDLHMDLHKVISSYTSSPMSIDEFLNSELEAVRFIPDYIGISMSFSNGHVACLKMTAACKKRWDRCTIIAGGMHATTFTAKIITEPSIDYVIRGPGDISFIELLNTLEEKRAPEQISGVVTGLHNVHQISPRFEDLDAIPHYPFDLIDMEYLVVHESTSPVFEKEIRTGLIMMSRGCPFSCTYCSARYVHGKIVFFKSIDRILSEIEYLVNVYKVNKLCIIDDLFGADKNYFYAFFKELEKRDFKLQLVIPGGLSFKIFNEAMIDVLVEHGLKAVNFPLESGSAYVQNEIIKKHIDLKKAASLLHYAKGKGLFVGINIVIGSPGETKELMHETFEFIKTLPVDWASFFIAYPYPGTQMTQAFLERGEISEDTLMEIWESSAQGFKARPFDTKEISGKELSDMVYDFNIALNFFSNYNIRTKNYMNMLLKLHKIIDRYPFHVVALSCRAHCYCALGEVQKARQDIASMYRLIASQSESQHMFERYKKDIEDAIASCSAA